MADARTGLTDLIEIVRGMCDSGTADYAIGSANYWDDVHIQTVLDRNRRDIYHEQLTPTIDYLASGSISYTIYHSRYRNYEKTTGGTSIFYVEDSTGSDIGTANYTPNYERGIIEFGSDTGGSTYFLTGRSYDLNASAADIWRQKAAHYAGMFSFSTDNQRIDKGVLIKNATQMADYFDSLAAPHEITIFRDDVDEYAIE